MSSRYKLEILNLYLEDINKQLDQLSSLQNGSKETMAQIFRSPLEQTGRKILIELPPEVYTLILDQTLNIKVSRENDSEGDEEWTIPTVVAYIDQLDNELTLEPRYTDDYDRDGELRG